MLGNMFPNQIDFMNHLVEFSNLTDEEIEYRSSNENGINAESALTLFLERELCKGAIDNIKEELNKLK